MYTHKKLLVRRVTVLYMSLVYYIDIFLLFVSPFDCPSVWLSLFVVSDESLATSGRSVIYFGHLIDVRRYRVVASRGLSRLSVFETELSNG